MPLRPEVTRYLEDSAKAGGRPRAEMTVHELRELIRGRRRLSLERVELPRVENQKVGHVPVRLYFPSGEEGLRALVYAHGGIFCLGDLETHDTLCRALAAQSGWLIAAVDYRLAPEHPFPAAVEDVCAVTEWMSGRAECVGVGGDSAGGNLAAVTALEARDRGGPKLLCQLLLYPMTDATCASSSYEQFAAGYGPGADDMKRGWDFYLPAGTNPKDPRISPLWAESFGGLPPAYVMTVEYDTLRDEGEQYAQALEEAGVPVTRARYEGAIHGILQLGGALEVGRRAVTDAAAWLRSFA